MQIPDWVKDAVFYQIFPDRFANGDLTNDPPNVQPWGEIPDAFHFQGGDLAGIEQRLDYLQDLGINALYLNPIFLSPSTHRYNTVDYYCIDPKLGSRQDFRRLLRRAHRKGMRIILDGVFNHCGRGFFAFNDLLENGSNSPYQDWFHIKKFPLHAYGPGKSSRYEAWWGYKSLPKFNTHAPAVRRYILDVARHWIDEGIDGWRLDVPNEIDDDTFWAEFRYAVKKGNPQAYLLGEIWDVQSRWVDDEHFDGLMNYPVRSIIIDSLIHSISNQERLTRLEKIQDAYGMENLYGMYLLLGSHDTERIITLLNHDMQKVRLAYLLLFAFPGAPAIYYGDEIGLRGGKDPDCRRAFVWAEEDWDVNLRDWIKRLIGVRRSNPIFRHGNLQVVDSANAENGFVLLRQDGEKRVLIASNFSSQKTVLKIHASHADNPGNHPPVDLLGGNFAVMQNGEEWLVELPAWAGGYFSL
ncbi:MAG: glycoside hydrolase family 13 protein [Bellilinea sp.]|jgi:glycosidase